MNKRVVLFAIVLLAVACSLGFAAPKKSFVVGFANPYIGNSWRAQYLEDAQAGAQKYKSSGLLKDFIIANSNNDVSQQLQQLNNMIARHVDALLIDPVSATSLGPVIDKAKAANILVVISAGSGAYPGTYAVLHDHALFARTNTKWLCDTLHGNGNIVIITGLVGNTADQLRINVQNEVIAKYPGIKVLASAPANWTPSQAASVMSTFLSTYNQIDGILQQDVTAPGVVQAYDNAGKSNIPPMIGDATFGFLRTWAKNPHLNCIAYPMHPGLVIDALGVTLRLLQGKHFKEGVLQPNPLDPNVVNTILEEPPYIITNTADQNATWMQDYKIAKSVGVQEAAKMGIGKADATMIDGVMSDEAVDALFE